MATRLPLLAALLAAAPLAALAQDAAPTGLLADFKRSPALGVRAAPALGWIVPACAAGGDGAQVAYEIVVSELNSGQQIWDSGRVAGNISTYVTYAGAALAPATRYTWTVKTWTADCASPASAPATFLTAPWAGFDPTAMFITTPTASTFGYFRTVIQVPSGIKSAIAFVAAYVDEPLLSGYKLYVNDKLVNIGPGRGEAPVFGGDGLFRSLPITTLDVSALFATGGTYVLALQAMHGPPKVIMQLEMIQADGRSKNVIVTDASWRAFDGDAHRKPGPATKGGSAGTGFLEYIDARGEPVGWRAPGFVEGAGWTAATAAAPSSDEVKNLHPRMQEPMAVDETLAPVSMRPIPSPPIPPTGPTWCGVVPENSNLELVCWNNTVIEDVAFASFGTPTGSCPDKLVKGSCDASTSLAVVKKACVGKTSCTVPATNDEFGGDPCYDTAKSLGVQLQCPGTPPPPPPPTNPTSFLATFEKEFQGGLRLDVTDGVAGSTVEIACGEHVTGDTVDYTWGWEFTWTLRDGAQRLEQHKYMECRFVRLTFSGPAPTFTLGAWRASYPWYDGDSSFTSNDETLNAVYDLCRYTLFSASLDTYTDSNTRERTPYEADGIIAMSGRLLVQREFLYPRHSHAYVLQNPTWPVEWKQLDPFLGWQDYMATGEPDLAMAFTDTMHDRSQISFMNSSLGVLNTDPMGSHIVYVPETKPAHNYPPPPSDPCLDPASMRSPHALPPTPDSDWMPNGDESDQTCARHMFTCTNHASVSNGMAARGLEMLAEMVTAGGGDASKTAAEAAALRLAINTNMYNAANMSYCDGVCSEVKGASLVMTNMMYLNFGFTQDQGAAAIDKAWQTVATWGLQQLGDYGAFWYQMALSSSYYSPFYDTPDDGTAIVTALTKCDTYSWCSGLRDDNLTMTRESWHDGTFSHGWGTSAITGVSWSIMGVHELSPGWASFSVKPKLGPLTFANGTTPTIRGPISVSATPGAVEVGVPCNSKATLCAPRSSSDGPVPLSAATHRLFLNGAEVLTPLESAGHLCLPKEVGCGAGGEVWRLRVEPRA